MAVQVGLQGIPAVPAGLMDGLTDCRRPNFLHTVQIAVLLKWACSPQPQVSGIPRITASSHGLVPKLLQQLPPCCCILSVFFFMCVLHSLHGQEGSALAQAPPAAFPGLLGDVQCCCPCLLRIWILQDCCRRRRRRCRRRGIQDCSLLLQSCCSCPACMPGIFNGTCQGWWRVFPEVHA